MQIKYSLMTPNYPSLYQVNTRVLLTDLSTMLSRRATLDDIPDEFLDQIAGKGFHWIWFLSVWKTGALAREVSLENEDFRRDFEATLPDLKEEDIGGSGFAIAEYAVHPDLGGPEALQRLRTRMKKRKLRLMLDFVPNHLGPDHSWVQQHPEFLIAGTESDFEKHPQNYMRLKVRKRERIFAHGRDPFFPGWPDTVQVDFSNGDAVEAMTAELLRICGQCDGLRCDMAMLVLPDVFERTWGRRAYPFWSKAIKKVRAKAPGFVFMAEVYWDMEWTLQQEGFDYAYDKRLYDRLHEGNARPVREHFYAGLDYQNKLARFLENHDEPRVAEAFDREIHMAAAVITFFSPGLRFFHQGQLEGRRKRISPHLIRGPHEVTDKAIEDFYERLLSVLKKPTFRSGQWQLRTCVPAWEGNGSWDAFIAFSWEEPAGTRALVVVNYAPHASQCFVQLPFAEMVSRNICFRDMMSEVSYEREGNDLLTRGLYLDIPAWAYHIFELERL
jgi:hypothetical protein